MKPMDIRRITNRILNLIATPNCIHEQGCKLVASEHLCDFQRITSEAGEDGSATSELTYISKRMRKKATGLSIDRPGAFVRTAAAENPFRPSAWRTNFESRDGCRSASASVCSTTPCSKYSGDEPPACDSSSSLQAHAARVPSLLVRLRVSQHP